MGLFRYLTYASWFLSLALGYKIDGSCTRMGYENTIRSAMTSAFAMARAASTRLAASPWTPDTRELVDFLFAKEGQHASERDMDKTLQVFRDILYVYETEITGDGEVPWTNVIIFCNDDRLQLVNKKKSEYRDQSNGLLFKYNEQACRGSFMDRIALAVTMNPEDPTPDPGEGKMPEKRKPTQIQLCPWFMDWIKNKEFKLNRDVLRTNIGQHIIKKADAGKYGFRQIDVYSLLDKVLLHEMTHGRMAFPHGPPQGPGLDDVTDPAAFIVHLPAYGWKRAMRLARSGTKVGENSIKAPDHNAENLALFGSVSVLLDDPTSPRKVGADGKIIPRT